MIHRKNISTLLLTLLISFSVFCQTSTLDTIKTKKHSPKLAWMMSAVLPGAGQVYNRKYWKVPIIYASAGAIFYYLKDNNDYYQKLKNDYVSRKNDPAYVSKEFSYFTSISDLQSEKERFRKYRDLNIIMMAGLYFLNIIDATVDAYFFDYDK